jgi:hypothetical protein
VVDNEEALQRKTLGYGFQLTISDKWSHNLVPADPPLASLPATRVQFREGASNWVDTAFLQATTFEHEHEHEHEHEAQGENKDYSLAMTGL